MKRTALLFCLSSVTAIYVSAQHTAAALDNRVDVELAVVQCPQDALAVPDISIRDVRDGQIIVDSKTETLMRDQHVGFEIVHLRMPPVVATLKVRTPHCIGGQLIVILDGQPRHASVVLGEPRLIGDDDCAIAGRLPVDGLAITIRDQDGLSWPVELDGRAYYFENAGLGDYVLEINRGSLGNVRIPIQLRNGRGGRSGACLGLAIIRDIQLQELVVGEPSASPK